MSLNSQCASDYYSIMDCEREAFTKFDRIAATSVLALYLGYVTWVVYGLFDRDDQQADVLKLALIVTGAVHFGFIFIQYVLGYLSARGCGPDLTRLGDSIGIPYFGLDKENKRAFQLYDSVWFVNWIVFLNKRDSDSYQTVGSVLVILGTVLCVIKAGAIIIAK